MLTGKSITDVMMEGVSQVGCGPLVSSGQWGTRPAATDRYAGAKIRSRLSQQRRKRRRRRRRIPEALVGRLSAELLGRHPVKMRKFQPNLSNRGALRASKKRIQPQLCHSLTASPQQGLPLFQIRDTGKYLESHKSPPNARLLMAFRQIALHLILLFQPIAVRARWHNFSILAWVEPNLQMHFQLRQQLYTLPLSVSKSVSQSVVVSNQRSTRLASLLLMHFQCLFNCSPPSLKEKCTWETFILQNYGAL